MATQDESVLLCDGWLRVPLDGGHADFHARWLRHNCDEDRHPTTRERIVDSSDLPADLTIQRAWIEGDALRVRWRHDGRTSRYALAWLAEHAYARDRELVPPPPGDVTAVEIARARGQGPDELVIPVLERLASRGLAIVRRDPADATPPEDETEAWIDALAGRGLAVIGTHFGRIEDLRTDNTTNQNTDQLGYTDAPVDLHTDQPFLDDPPRYQALQSIRAADEGGASYLVDAEAAALHLASVDAPAARLLSSVPVRFHRRQQHFERLVVAPILGTREGRFFVRYSYFTTAPHQLPFAEMESWYGALDAFARLVRDPRHQYRFLLRPGDLLLYDNHRMLHARTSFRGARWVRGIYFDPV